MYEFFSSVSSIMKSIDLKSGLPSENTVHKAIKYMDFVHKFFIYTVLRERLQPPLISLYFSGKMGNRCSDLPKSMGIQRMGYEQIFNNSNMFESQCLVWPPLFFNI